MGVMPRPPPTSRNERARWSLLLKRAPMRNTTKSPSISALIRRPAIWAMAPPRVLQVLPLSLSLAGNPLDGQYVARVEHTPPVVAGELEQAIRALLHAEQRVLVVVQGPPAVEAPHHQANLPGLAEHRLQLLHYHRTLHTVTLRPVANRA